jgi:hypothetical protein
VANSAAQADRLNAIARQAVLNGVGQFGSGEAFSAWISLAESRNEALALEQLAS